MLIGLGRSWSAPASATDCEKVESYLARLRGGIIGLGRMGLTHFAILNTHPSVEMVSAAEPDRFMRTVLEQQVPVRTYRDIDEMLGKEGLDFVVISTPPDTHADLIRAAFDRKLHVFVEKPFTTAVADARILSSMASHCELTNQVGYVLRFHDIFSTGKRILADGTIGRVHAIRIDMAAATVVRPPRGGWRADRGRGGCLLEFASHAIDLLFFITGDDATVRDASLPSFISADVEDAVFASFDLANGGTGNISVNWSDASQRKPYYSIEVIGSNGKLQMDSHSLKVFLLSATAGFSRGWTLKYSTELARPVRFYLRGNEFTRQLDHFVDTIATSSRLANVSSFKDALKTDETIAKIRGVACQI